MHIVRWCKSYENPFQSRFKLSAAVPIKWDVQLAAVFQNVHGANYGASTTFALAAIQPSLGRPLSGGVRTVTIDLLPPFSAFGDRINQIDARVSKKLTLGGAHLQANFDLYNMLNAATPVTFNNTFSLTGTNRWLQPTQILDARLAKFSVQIDF